MDFTHGSSPTRQRWAERVYLSSQAVVKWTKEDNNHPKIRALWVAIKRVFRNISQKQRILVLRTSIEKEYPESTVNLYCRYAKEEKGKWSFAKRIVWERDVLWEATELKHGWYSPEKAQQHYDALISHKKSCLTVFMERIAEAPRKCAGFYLGIFHFNYSLYDKWLKVQKLGAIGTKKHYGFGQPKMPSLKEAKDSLFNLMQPGFFANG